MGNEKVYVFFSDQFVDTLLWSVLGTISINMFNGLIRKSLPNMALHMIFVIYYKRHASPHGVSLIISFVSDSFT